MNYIVFGAGINAKYIIINIKKMFPESLIMKFLKKLIQFIIQPNCWKKISKIFVSLFPV